MAYTAEQQRNIEAIIRVGHELGASDRDIQIALAVALQESSLRILNYGDKAGPDSRGLFQQRDNWGTLTQRMDAESSARLFFLGGKDGSPGLLKIKNRNNMSYGEAAYSVQHFSKKYQSRYDTAANTVAPLVGIKVSPKASTTPSTTATPAAAKAKTTGAAAAENVAAQTEVDPHAGWATTRSGQSFPDFDDDGRADDFVPDEDMGNQDFDIARIKARSEAFMDIKRAEHAARIPGVDDPDAVGGGGAAGGGGTAVGGPMSAQEAATRYGYAVTFFQSVPELLTLFNRAMAEQWTPERFAGAFQDTAWYKTHSEAYRQIYAQKIQDPATYQQNVAQQKASIQDTAGALGVQLDAVTVSKLTDDSLAQGWTPQQLRNHLATLVKVVQGTGHFAGQAGDIEGDLRRMAESYALPISDATLLARVRGIAGGDSTLNDYQAQLMSQAQMMYPGYAEQIKNGMTLRDIANPYIEQMAQLMEMDPANITMFDQNIQQALMGKGQKGADGKEVGFSMYDFQQQMRRDPRWSKTKQAQDVTSAAMLKVLSDFGFAK